jgi:hypothetical protein
MEKNARPDYELALDDIFENAWRDRNENYGDERKQAKYKAREAILTNWNNHDRTRKPTMRINPLWFIGVWMLWEETIGRTLDGEQRAAR